MPKPTKTQKAVKPKVESKPKKFNAGGYTKALNKHFGL